MWFYGKGKKFFGKNNKKNERFKLFFLGWGIFKRKSLRYNHIQKFTVLFQ